MTWESIFPLDSILLSTSIGKCAVHEPGDFNRGKLREILTFKSHVDLVLEASRSHCSVFLVKRAPLPETEVEIFLREIRPNLMKMF